jgi:two-component system cell cycle response regulator
VSDFEEPTRVTTVGPSKVESSQPKGTDCIVVIYTKQPTLLGKRFPLEASPTRIGRGADNQIVLDGDSVSRRHAQIERRDDGWVVLDVGSTNGTYCNDDQIQGEVTLRNGDRVKVGPTIFKFLSGADVESQYHEEIYRLTIMDGLTQAFNKRATCTRRSSERSSGRGVTSAPSAMLMFDIDHFKRINDVHGHLAGDFVLKELARLMQQRIRRDEVFARYGGEEFCIILPETNLDGARLARGVASAEGARSTCSSFQADKIKVTISIGAVAQLTRQSTTRTS